ncbi:hypothetical protein Avbf_18183 [Armadillidium vulgare]|nr:hypothetical protein Avbf_18183 [Armadillidium vulgare]
MEMLHNYDVFGERSPRESFTTVTTNLNETTRRKMIPHERISGDYRQNKHDLRSKLSQSSHSSPSPLVICTLEFIDSIKSLKRSPQHIFVEVRVPGSVGEFRVPSSLRPYSTVEDLIHVCSEPSFQFEIVSHVVGPFSFVNTLYP